MGLYYRTMIKEIREKFHNQKEKSLEEFLLDNKEEIQAEYQQMEMMLFLNFTEILKEENGYSEKIEKRLKELIAEDDMF